MSLIFKTLYFDDSARFLSQQFVISKRDVNIYNGYTDRHGFL